MIRDYEDENSRKDPDFFIGYEVEHTPAYQLKTLFVVGIQPVSEILRRANALDCKAVYFGANHSFGIDGEATWEDWEEMINGVLDHPDDYWCTLDFDVQYVEGVIECCLAEHTSFIPIISVKIPYADQLGYNAVVKIDDKDFKASNFGVWCHKLRDLMDHDKFTNWKKYKEDKIV